MYFFPLMCYQQPTRHSGDHARKHTPPTGTNLPGTSWKAWLCSRGRDTAQRFDQVRGVTETVAVATSSPAGAAGVDDVAAD